MTSNKNWIIFSYTMNSDDQPKENSEFQNPDSGIAAVNAPFMWTSPQPFRFLRDINGLLPNIKYEYNVDGTINWRAMVNPKHIYINKEYFDRRQQPVPKTIDGLDDAQLIIKLAGIKEVARLRGYSSTSYNLLEFNSERAVAVCSINFIPNFENPNGVVFSSIANATVSNTNGLGQKFLESIAENRSFVRCVRNFLNIHIVVDEEIDVSSELTPKDTKSINPTSPQGVLEEKARTVLGCQSFDNFKSVLRDLWRSKEYNNEKVTEWNGYEDIPAKECMALISLVSKKSDQDNQVGK